LQYCLSKVFGLDAAFPSFPAFDSTVQSHVPPPKKQDAEGDIAYENDEDETKKGFRGLKRLGVAAGRDLKHYPLKVDSLTANDADNLVKILTELPRPTYIMCK
jgi:hypothetical protein